MTQPSKILSLAAFAAALLLLQARAAAQAYSPGQLIVVNNSPAADHDDAHVRGDLVSSNTDGTHFTIRYFDLLSSLTKGFQTTGNSISFQT